MSTPFRVVFMGTPEFSLPTLRALHANSEIAKVVAVYTQPDRPAGRGQKLTPPPVKVLAQEFGYEIHQPESINTPEERRKLADYMADFFIVIAYAQFLSKGVLNLPRGYCINVHSSLLPKFRGAAPIQFAIWKGEKESGVTTMKLVSKMDAGPMLLQSSIPIHDRMTSKELHDKLSTMGADLLIETLKQLQARTLVERDQDESGVTFASLIKKEDGLLDWTKPVIELDRQIRALNPWPGTYAPTKTGNLKIVRATPKESVLGAKASARPGSLHSDSGNLFVKCADGWLELNEVQPEGRKAMAARDFLNGLRSTDEELFLTP